MELLNNSFSVDLNFVWHFEINFKADSRWVQKQVLNFKLVQLVQNELGAIGKVKYFMFYPKLYSDIYGILVRSKSWKLPIPRTNV